MLVLVQDSAKVVASSDVKVDDSGVLCDRYGHETRRCGLAQGTVWPVAVVMDLELA